jgi:hypothetical protein
MQKLNIFKRKTITTELFRTCLKNANYSNSSEAVNYHRNRMRRRGRPLEIRKDHFVQPYGRNQSKGLNLSVDESDPFLL